jgi:hypothetical protein
MTCNYAQTANNNDYLLLGPAKDYLCGAFSSSLNVSLQRDLELRPQSPAVDYGAAIVFAPHSHGGKAG